MNKMFILTVNCVQFFLFLLWYTYEILVKYNDILNLTTYLSYRLIE